MSPRRAARSATPEFLWINRTPDSERLSASRQEPEEVRTITKHARQWRASLRRQQRLRNARTEASHAQSVVGWNRHSFMTSPGGDSTDGSTSASPLPPLRITSPVHEPFSYLETQNDAWWSRNAFQFAVEKWMPCLFQTLQRFDDGLVHFSVLVQRRIINACLSNRMHLFAVLAASTGYQKFVLQERLDRNDSPEYCMTRALQHVRHYLATNPMPEEMIIFDLRVLAAFELYVANLSGARTHLRMAGHLVEAISGFANVDRSLAALCWVCDIDIAERSGWAPVFPLTWDVDSLPDLQLQTFCQGADHQISSTGSSLAQFAEHAWGQGPNNDMFKITLNVIEWFHVVRHAQCHPSSRALSCAWIRVKAHALRYRLLKSNGDMSSSLTSNPDWLLQHALRQTLLLLICDIESTRARDMNEGPEPPLNSLVGVMPALLTRLRTILTPLANPADWPGWSEPWELIFWICSMASQVADPQTRRWYLGLAASVAQSHGGLTQMTVVDVLSRHLYRLDEVGNINTEGLEVFWTA